jgi:hypothetical protein
LLNHWDGATFDADGRIGTKLLREDGSTLVERIAPPHWRLGLIAPRSVWPV